MEGVQAWIKAELKQISEMIENIPDKERKGPLVRSHRQRARDLTIALRFVEEFEVLSTHPKSIFSGFVTPCDPHPKPQKGQKSL